MGVHRAPAPLFWRVPAQSVEFGFTDSLAAIAFLLCKDPVAGPCVEAIIFHIPEKSSGTTGEAHRRGKLAKFNL